jgi:hypothetical protein
LRVRHSLLERYKRFTRNSRRRPERHVDHISTLVGRVDDRADKRRERNGVTLSDFQRHHPHTRRNTDNTFPVGGSSNNPGNMRTVRLVR